MSSKLKFLGALAAAAVLSSSAQAQLANEKNVTLAMAQAIANGAMEKCKSMGFKVSVAVIDRAGLPVVTLRGDGSGLHTPEGADRKAFTARTFRAPSAAFLKRMMDDQAAQILGTTDVIAERVRKIGGTTLRSIGHIARLQRIKDNDADYVTPLDMLAELRDNNMQLTTELRATHSVCDEHGDVAGASLIENWIDEAEGRTWFLYEASRTAESA